MKVRAGGIVMILCALVAAFVVLPAVAISVRGLRDDVFNADVAVVLGSDLTADNRPTERLASRLDVAAELYWQGYCREIIVSGGLSSHGASEVDAMRDHLVARGISPNVIILDPNGVNTRATARFTSEYLRSHDMSSVIVATNFFHIPRTVMTVKSYGVDRVGSAYARAFEPTDVIYLLREIPAFFAYSLGFK